MQGLFGLVSCERRHTFMRIANWRQLGQVRREVSTSLVVRLIDRSHLPVCLPVCLPVWRLFCLVFSACLSGLICCWYLPKHEQGVTA
jgi:hypothetical protein